MSGIVERQIALLRRLDADELIAAAPTATVISASLGTSLDEMRIVALGGAHKARITLGRKHFTASELADSRNWLEQNGMGPSRP